MLADTEFTRKSGEMGTSMFSKPGKRTTYQYLCFDDKHKNDNILGKTVNEDEEDDEPLTKGEASKTSDARNPKTSDYLNHLTRTGFENGTIDRAKT
jgi:hypothetical protein